MESFIDGICFRNNSIWKTNLKNEASCINKWSDLLQLPYKFYENTWAIMWIVYNLAWCILIDFKMVVLFLLETEFVLDTWSLLCYFVISENFYMSLFWCITFEAPTHFLKAICPRYGPDKWHHRQKWTYIIC